MDGADLRGESVSDIPSSGKPRLNRAPRYDEFENGGLPTMTIGRNDLCPCGSGIKFKKCHLRVPAQPQPRQVDPRSQELQARAWAMFDAKIAAQKGHEQTFGKVRPIPHTVAWGKRLVSAGSTIYSLHPNAGFADFLREYLWMTLGDAWCERELSKPSVARHPVAQWKTHIDDLISAGVRNTDSEGRVCVVPDGLLSAYITLAYDLYLVREYVRFRDELLERLRGRGSFVGARYELLVAATFVRAGFHVDLEDDKRSRSKVPEFLAVHPVSKFVVAVEAKARSRRPSDKQPTTVRMEDRIEEAALKALARPHIPFVLFVDAAMPPEDRAARPSWLDEIAASVDQVVARHRSVKHPFDWVFFTNIPHQYGVPGEPDPPRHYADYVPDATRVPEGLRDDVITAVQQYGAIPQFEPQQ